MVDFQSRNTRRGRSEDETDEEPDGSADGADEARPVSDEPAGDAEAESDADGELTPVSAAVVTVSDDRTAAEDPPAEAVESALEAAGHGVVTREVLRASHDSVQGTVATLANRDDVDAVVTTGGTGVAPGDVTVEAVHPLIDKGLPGFGEAFRRRYAEQVGSDAVATRATAGLVDRTPVFCLPGEAAAARLGAAEFVVEQAGRLSRLAGTDGAADP